MSFLSLDYLKEYIYQSCDVMQLMNILIKNSVFVLLTLLSYYQYHFIIMIHLLPSYQFNAL